MRSMLVVIAWVALLAAACGKSCPSNQLCAGTQAQGDICVTTSMCNFFDGGGCGPDAVCTTAGPCCTSTGLGKSCEDSVLTFCCPKDGGCR
jgi:hypothetical protein